MATPDFFGILDKVRRLSPPAGLEAAHRDGFSWARNGLSYGDSTKLTPDDWNRIIANLRGVLLGAGMDLDNFDPSSPLLAREAIKGYIRQAIPDGINEALPIIEAALEEAAATATSAAASAAADADRAEAARDASMVSAQTYPNEADGRAAVIDGQSFDVVGAGDVAVLRYRRTNSTTSVLIATFPSKAFVDVVNEQVKQVVADMFRVPTGGQFSSGSYYGDIVFVDMDNRVLFDSGSVPSYGVSYDSNFGDFVVVDRDSRVVFDSGVMPTCGKHFDGRFGDVIIDADNRVLGSLGGSTGGNGGGNAGGWAFITVDGVLFGIKPPQSVALSFAPDGTAAYVSLDGTLVTYSIAGGSYAGTYKDWLEAEGALAGFVTSLEYCAIMGQSLALTAVAGPLYTVPETGLVDLLNWNGGPKPSAGGGSSSAITEAQIRTLVPAFENTRDTPTTPFARARRASGNGVTGFISANWAVGGTTYDEIKPGTNIYRNGLRAARRAKAWADLRGLPIAHRFVQYMHGENAQATDGPNRGNYQARILDYVDTYRSDMTKIFGHAPMFITRQTSSWGNNSYGVARSGVPLAMLYAALENPAKIICSGPDYMLPFGPDRLHYHSLGACLRGEYNARSAKRFEQAGAAAARPCYVQSAVRTGNTVVLTGHVPVAPLVIDTETLTNPGNYGVEWIDNGDGNSVSITNVAITDNGGTGENKTFQVTLTLSAVPTSTGQFIGLARTTTPGVGAGLSYGPRTNFHDSAPEVSSYDQSFRMWNWLCVDQLLVTTS